MRALGVTSLIGLIALLVVQACTQSPTASSSPAASSSRSAVGSSSPLASASSSPAPTTCNLYVSGAAPGSGGFIRVQGSGLDPFNPLETFTADPQSNVSYPGIASALGLKGLAFDTIHHRWLPVPRAWVMPDFSRYAYPAADGVHWVDLNGGNTDTKIPNTIGIAPYLLAAEPDGVYGADQTTTLERVTWTGDVSIVDRAHNRNTIAVGDGVVYGSTESPPAITQIDRIDVGTGVVTPWFVWGARNLVVLGVDSKGFPMILDEAPNVPEQVWNPVVASTSDSPLGQPAGTVGTQGNAGTVTYVQGQGGIWFASTTGGVTFSSQSISSRMISQYTGYIAGPCIPAS